MRQLIAVTGMVREARCFPPGPDIVLSGGGGNCGLADKIEAAIARGGRTILSAGVCGGLKPGLPAGSVILASAVVSGAVRYETDASWRARLARALPASIEGAIAGSDAIIASPAAKAALHAATGALAIDLESHIAAQAAAAHGLPFAALRVVIDEAQDSLPPAAFVAMTAEGRINAAALARSLLARPWQIPALIGTGRRAETAFAELLRSLRLIVAGPGDLDLG